MINGTNPANFSTNNVIGGISSASGAKPAGGASNQLDQRELSNWQQPQSPTSLNQDQTLLAQRAPNIPGPPSSTALAILSRDVYRDRSVQPLGFHTATPNELKTLGLTREMLNPGGNSEFRAQVYVKSVGGEKQYVVAMRGTRFDNRTDWGSNIQQALGQNSDHYNRALAIGNALARSPGANVTITGHSLGGGLAAATAVASGRNAVTFNAAGLSNQTIERADQIRSDAGAGGRGSVQAFYVYGEALTGLQQNSLGRLPTAFGNNIALPAIAPQGTIPIVGESGVAKHGLDWVINGLQATGL